MLTTCTVVAALALGSVSSASYAPAPAAVTTAPITAPSYPCTNPDAALTGRDVVSSGVVHSGRVAGSTASEIASKINARAFESAGGATKPCADFSHAELDAIVSEMWCHFSPTLAAKYAARAGDGRQLRYESLSDYEANWAKEQAVLHDADGAEALHKAKCAEVLMLWTHHIPAAKKGELLQVAFPSIPTLKEYSAEHAAHPTAGGVYAEKHSCITGHNNTGRTITNHTFPHWPDEVHYHGMGHGAYPFWMGPGGSGGSGAPIEVWWSQSKAAEKFYHASCSLKECGAKTNGPCYNLFVGKQPSPLGYMYSAAGDFCCLTQPGPDGRSVHNASLMARPLMKPSRRNNADKAQFASEPLSSPSADFMDTFTYKDTEDFTGTFYTGKIKKYLVELPSTEAVTWFWYMTDMQDRPVEQGEGGHGSGIVVYHEYNTSSFESTTHDPSVFEPPAICKTTTVSCAFP